MQQQMKVHPTQHAKCRARQRGLRRGDLELIAAFADRELDAGEGCEFWTLSAEAARSLVAEGTSRQHVDRLRRLGIIINPERGQVVTVFPTTVRRRSRQSRRQRRSR
jgi:hypothetical protein